MNLTLTFFPDDAQVSVPGQARLPRGALHLRARLICDAAHSNTIVEAAPAGPRVGVLEAERHLQQGVEGELQRQRVDDRERRPGAAPRREARVPRAREDAVPDDRDPRERPGADLCTINQ